MHMRQLFIKYMYFFCMLFFSTQMAYGRDFGDNFTTNKPASLQLHAQSTTAYKEAGEESWRIRINEAAVVQGDTVYLRDIAQPMGDISNEEWQKLANIALWASPENDGKPLQINNQRLKSALVERLGSVAYNCLLPNSLTIQKGGGLFLEEDLRSLVVKTLTPQINGMAGTHGYGELTDFRLPAYVFTPMTGQGIQLEHVELRPGRVSLRFAVMEIDNSVVSRFTGSAFLNMWINVPSVSVPVGKGEKLDPSNIVFKQINLAYQKGDVWDGKGGPWQLTRSIGASQAILITDLQPQSTILKGDTINLIYQNGSMRLSVPAEAMENGTFGDTILVRNLDSKKQVYGVVQDASTVRVN